MEAARGRRRRAWNCTPTGSIPVDAVVNATGEALPLVSRGVVVAGDGAGDAARIVAEAHGWPLFAEPTSGARTGDACVAGYVHALGTPEGRELAASVELVVVIGRPTLTRGVQELIGAAPILFIAAHGARWREAPLHADPRVAAGARLVARASRRDPR